MLRISRASNAPAGAERRWGSSPGRFPALPPPGWMACLLPAAPTRQGNHAHAGGYNVTSGDLPVYATSHCIRLGPGEKKKQPEHDLDGIFVAETPWLLDRFRQPLATRDPKTGRKPGGALGVL